MLRSGGKLILSVPYKGLFRFGSSNNVQRGVSSHYRRYSDADLTRLLFLKFRVLKKHYGGLFLYPLLSAAHDFVQRHFRRDWGLLFKKIGNLDYNVSWGKWSSHVILLAEKI